VRVHNRWRHAEHPCGDVTHVRCDTGEGESGGWERFGEKTIYDSRWVRLGLVAVRAPNGERWGYQVVHLGRIAIVLAVDGQDRALMLWRYRSSRSSGCMSCWVVWCG